MYIENAGTDTHLSERGLSNFQAGFDNRLCDESLAFSRPDK
jgi:hypothetical protein